MRPKTPTRWKAGDTISASRLNEMLDLILRLDISVSHGSALRIQQSGTGTVLSLDLTGLGFLAVANGNIPARSGSAAGIGSVFRVITAPTFAGSVITGVTLSASTIPVKVYNPSSTTMTGGQGINTGQYCWVQMDNSGLYMVTPLECV